MGVALADPVRKPVIQKDKQKAFKYRRFILPIFAFQPLLRNSSSFQNSFDSYATLSLWGEIQLGGSDTG